MFRKAEVLLFGQTNVGKSTLFNRLTRSRKAVVYNSPGVTRDFLSGDTDDGFVVIDSGGLGGINNPFSCLIEERVVEAAKRAKLILWVVDCKAGVTAFDEEISKRLKQFGQKVFVVINKVDSEKDENIVGEFYSLGWDIVIPISAEHNINIDTLRSAILDALPEAQQDDNVDAKELLKFAIVGRPNVGKSSISNAILGENRMLVSDISGTTRDAVECRFEWKFRDGNAAELILVDTAGLRKKTADPIEFFASVRTERAIQTSHLSIVLIDAVEGPTQLDKNIINHIIDSGKGCLLVVNKWDLAEELFKQDELDNFRNIYEFKKSFLDNLRSEIPFCNPPIVFVSSKTSSGLDVLMSELVTMNERLQTKINTGALNRLLQKLVLKNSPKSVNGKLFKIYYAVQISSSPFTLQFFCNKIKLLQSNYKKYLENAIRENFSLNGCPIVFKFVEKPKNTLIESKS